MKALEKHSGTVLRGMDSECVPFCMAANFGNLSLLRFSSLHKKAYMAPTEAPRDISCCWDVGTGHRNGLLTACKCQDHSQCHPLGCCEDMGFVSLQQHASFFYSMCIYLQASMQVIMVASELLFNIISKAPHTTWINHTGGFLTDATL